jgi:hypothetical protein
LIADVLWLLAFVLVQVVKVFYAANSIFAPIYDWTSLNQTCFEEAVKLKVGLRLGKSISIVKIKVLERKLFFTSDTAHMPMEIKLISGCFFQLKINFPSG